MISLLASLTEIKSLGKCDNFRINYLMHVMDYIHQHFLQTCSQVNATEHLSDDKSTVVQVMAWCCQATNQYLIQCWPRSVSTYHYDDVIMTMLASQITSLTVVYSIVHSGVNQRKHQSSASLAFVREIHRGPVNFPHKWPVTRKMFPFDDVIMWHL